MSNLNDRRLAQIKLSENDIKSLVVDHILKNSKVAKHIDGKRFSVDIDWHVFKWDDPDYFATCTLVEVD